MAKVVLISYADKKFKKNQKRLNKSANKHGLKNIISYSREDLVRTKFYTKYNGILDQSRGAGYWLWKPFFIYKTLNELDEGDFLIYSDSGAVFVNSPVPLLKIASKEKILLFGNGEMNIKWNKKDCLIAMRCNSGAGFYSPQVSAGFQIYVNNESTRKFVKEWLSYCCIPGLIDDTTTSPTGYEEYAAFKAHRHDQSILTNLAIKYDLPLYRDPSQGGNHLKPKEFRKRGEWLPSPYKYQKLSEESPTERFKYPTIINHLRGTGRFKRILIKMHSKLPKWLRRILRRRR